VRLVEVDVLETERASLAGRAALLHTVSHHRREGKRHAKRGWRRSPSCRNRIAPWLSGSMPSSKPARQPLAETLVRDARVCRGRQGRLLLSKCAEVNSRYTTFRFNDTANRHEGAMWPTSFARTELTAADDARIGAPVKKALS
jgi:hypothetical protein